MLYRVIIVALECNYNYTYIEILRKEVANVIYYEIFSSMHDDNE